MYKLLNEDNKSIEQLMDYIDSKIVKLRTSKEIKSNIIKDIQDLYSLTIEPWLKENYLLDIEPSSKLEEQINNNLLELINYLNKL